MAKTKNSSKNATTGKSPKSKGFLGELWYWIRFFIEVILIVFTIRSLVMEPFYIPSSSMVPNLLVGDYVIVNKNAYGYSKYSFPFAMFNITGRIWESLPKRGEVIVFRNPYQPSVDYIKRAIGLPGDKIQMIKGHLHINGEPTTKIPRGEYIISPNNYINRTAPDYDEQIGDRKVHIVEMMGDKGYLDNTNVYEVPAGYIFAMGDNRDNSTDSRVLSEVGYIPIENLVGRAYIVLFSWNTDFESWKFWEFIRWDRFILRINE